MRTEKANYILDSFALIAHLDNEPGAVRLQEIFEQAERGKARLYMSIINLGEVAYITEREKGMNAVQAMLAAVDQLPIAIIEADRKLTFAAAHVKANYALSYADAFAAALTQDQQATLLTGDPEFRPLEKQLTIEWLTKR